MGLEVITILRKQKGMSVEELANKSGVPLGTLSKISAGITKDPKLETIKAIARALECSLEEFDDYDSDSIKKDSSIETEYIDMAKELKKHNITNEDIKKIIKIFNVMKQE